MTAVVGMMETTAVPGTAVAMTTGAMLASMKIAVKLMDVTGLRTELTDGPHRRTTAGTHTTG
jgi:hypothetical protein